MAGTPEITLSQQVKKLSPSVRAIVQAAKDHSSMPVVVVSGYVAEAFQAAEPLADLYLEKPVNPEELVTIINELLRSEEKGEQQQATAR